MNKKLRLTLAIVLGLVAVVYIGLTFFLGSIVKAGVNRFGPQLTQTKVVLSGAHISPLTGSGNLSGLAGYPATAGEPKLREACAAWVQRRYGVTLDAATQLLPVIGSREALFSLAQTVIDPSKPGATVVCPNPFYQIYEGAALLAGAQPHYANSDPARNFAVDWDRVPDEVWARTQLLFVCSPGNPTGAVMPLAEWEKLFALSDRHGFVIGSDECY